jgi:hypothetical protein
MAFKQLSDAEMEKEEKWEDVVAWMIAAIDNGFLDKNIKDIARACYDRKKVVDEGAIANPARWSEFPAYVHITDVAAAYRHAENVEKITKQVIDTVAPDQKPAEAKPKKRSLRAKTGVGKASPRPGNVRRGNYNRGEQTFRHTDGKLYDKSHVRGKLTTYTDSGKTYSIKITGVGTRAKVMFVGTNGSEETDPYKVPSKFCDVTDSGIVVKNPIFMPLNVIQPIIDTIKPIEEK